MITLTLFSLLPFIFSQGNKNLINVMRANKTRYAMSSKNEKIQMARDIVADIQNNGGRFLKRHKDDTWEIISNKYAYIKVGHGIRDLKDDDVNSVASERSREKAKSQNEKKRDRETSFQFDASISKNKKFARTDLGRTTQTTREVGAGGTGTLMDTNMESPSYKKELPPGTKLFDSDQAKEKGVNSDSKLSTAQAKKAKNVHEPRDVDVTCGRGKSFSNRGGVS
jgi:hypothetical protein